MILEKIIHEEHKLPLGLDFEDVELVTFRSDKFFDCNSN